MYICRTGRFLSPDFQRLVPKKLYPDYYKIIARPVALDTVKRKLDEKAYKHLREVRDDLNLIFRNAKTYNMKGSGIYVDAQTLQVLVEHDLWKSTDLWIIEGIVRGVAGHYRFG
jgi:chromatin structure-remodeling complex subunit RSC4